AEAHFNRPHSPNHSPPPNPASRNGKTPPKTSPAPATTGDGDGDHAPSSRPAPPPPPP
uniref:Uncharacterized protein n=1 Tax=Aegilops tauschii subsp. strangulata TaxID=200361 RepID=A0A453KZ66_AEGTS